MSQDSKKLERVRQIAISAIDAEGEDWNGDPVRSYKEPDEALESIFQVLTEDENRDSAPQQAETLF